MIFRNKKAELVKDKALIEIENFARNIQNKLNWSFEVMQEREDFKRLYELEKNKTKELESKINEKSEKTAILNAELIQSRKDINELYKIIAKLAEISEKDKDKLKEKIEELKKKVPTRIKSTKATTQKLGIKSGTKTSKIIKKVKEN